MGRIIHDAFDSQGAAANVSITGAVAAQVAAASLTGVAHITAAGTMAAQVVAASLAVTGEGLLEHHEAPSARLFRAAANRAHVAPPKDPAEILDYTISWVDVLEDGETIATSSWVIAGPDSAVVQGSGSRAATRGDESTTVWLAAGTASAEYTATNHITTSHSPPREYERSFKLAIANL